MAYELIDDGEVWFPDPLVNPPDDDGFFCYGGDLSVDRLLLAYSHGIFPWYSFRWHNEPLWYCPMDRFVIFPREIHISHSMHTMLNKHEYSVSFNACFDRVIRNCSEPRIDQSGAWLGDDMIKAYTELHKRGFAQSVEAWHGDELIGGLYGVTLGSCFFGESMFSLQPNGSKIALIALATALSQDENSLIDCQFETDHLKSMGGRHISYEEYMSILHQTIP